MSKYGKIETLYERDLSTFKVRVGELKNRTYSLLKTWYWTEKVDGTNIRCIWQDGKVVFGGKTDNAQIHADLIKWLYENVSPEKLREAFPDVAPECETVIYGEGFGAGIQKGGGDYSPIKKIIVFDVLIDGKWWLSYKNVCDVARKLGLDVVPSFGEMTLEDATEFVRQGFKSKCAINVSKDAEGLVGRPLETLFDKKGHRLITKLKTKDF
jgi:ATP-dependent RNA circularization protein (DNA/RNA ligase family)